MWHVPFFTEVLPRNAQELEDMFPRHMRYRTLREAMNGANEGLYDSLPLSAAAFTDFDVAEALGEPGALVVAEQVVRVRDPNSRPRWRNRVDFFCYKKNGDVVRYHPGRTERDNMRPHLMRHGSFCSTWPMRGCRVWAKLSTHSLPGWWSWRTRIPPSARLAISSSLPVRTWRSCVPSTFNA